jgi:hypothetical protein
MSARKPKIEYYWSPVDGLGVCVGHVVNWRLVGANSEIMCQSTQGFRDKADARRSVYAVAETFGTNRLAINTDVREVGPGRKP